MSKTQFVHGQELKEKLLSGIIKLNTAVSSTLGPGGRTVLINDQYGEVRVSKDGVSVAKAFGELEDPIETIGANLVKQVSIKSANEAGDGTTTSTLLATKIVEEGLKNIRQGTNAIEIKLAIDKVVDAVILGVKSKSVEVSSQEQIKQVATISGNNDEEVGNLIATAIEKVGREGIVTIEESKSGETSLEVVEGMQFDRGYKSPYFVTNNTNMQCGLENPYVLIYDGRISSAQELLQVLNKVNAENRSLLMISEDIGEEALATLIVNKMRGIVQVCAVKAPDFGERKTLILEDIAILTGGQVISKDKGHKLDKLTSLQLDSFLGKARLATISKEETTIVDGKGEEASIVKRAEEIKEQIEKASSFYEKEKLQERLGKLVGGVAIINVGGNSEVEIKEKRDRVEDALYATKAALADGIVAGGGMALYKAVQTLLSPEIGPEAIAHDIVKKACESPFRTILANTGRENWYEIAQKVLDQDSSTGNEKSATYDAKRGKVVDSIEEGLIDPCKVVITALKNAASVAGTILTTESVIFEKKSKDEKESVNPMMGM